MKIRENIPLRDLTTMKLGGDARYVFIVTSQSELIEAVNFATKKSLPIFVIGGGSNILASDDGFDGVIILNRIIDFTQLDKFTFHVGAGFILDDFCAKTCGLGLSGVECLSGVPGTIGAAIIQNVGAYSQSISETLLSVTAFNLDTNEIENLNGNVLKLGYRNSIWKDPNVRRHIIIAAEFQLKQHNGELPNYPSIHDYAATHEITDYSPNSIRQIILAVRDGKIPDPAKIASAGSFFKNITMTRNDAEIFKSKYPEAPIFEMPELDENHVNIPTAWLIDQAGLKNYENYGFKIWEKSPLIVVNINGQSEADLLRFEKEISAKVEEKFGILIEREPDLLG